MDLRYRSTMLRVGQRFGYGINGKGAFGHLGDEGGQCGHHAGGGDRSLPAAEKLDIRLP